ncbi:MAG: hypothetical protein AAB392_01800 [Patescibacteria group bacterium]
MQIKISEKIIKNNRGGFIQIAIVIVAALVLLKYAYDIDVLEKVYGWAMWVWSKYKGL